jgi:DNA-binding transcriptional LysR family regulator
MNLRSIDLNLLVVLRALVEECSVSRAGQRIGLSQSATSHALGRLRLLLKDELLVRTPTGMEPTPRALRLAGQVRSILEDIEATLAPDEFDPASETRSFDVRVETYETIVIVADLVDRIRREAPNIDLVIQSAPREIITDEIDKGQVDIAIGSFAGIGDRFMNCHLLTDRHVCVMRADHPLAQAPLTLDSFLEAPHLVVSMSGGVEDQIDATLAAAGHKRRIALRLPNGLAAAIALSRSDMIAVVTAGAARMFARVAPLSIVAPPLDLPSTAFRLIWHRRLNDSAAHIWLRHTLVSIGSGVSAAR